MFLLWEWRRGWACTASGREMGSERGYNGRVSSFFPLSGRVEDLWRGEMPQWKKWTWWAVWCRKPRDRLKNVDASVLVYGCMAVFVCRVCITSFTVPLCTHQPQMWGGKYHNTDMAALVCCGNLRWCHPTGHISGFPRIVAVKYNMLNKQGVSFSPLFSRVHI